MTTLKPTKDPDNPEDGETMDSYQSSRQYYGLTPKQWKFVNYYVGEANFVAAKAAELAGYIKYDDEGNQITTWATLKAVGAQNMMKPNIQKAVSGLLSDQVMPPTEVLSRLSKMARTSEADFFDTDPGNGQMIFNYEKARTLGKTGLIKKINFDSFGRVKSIELHDAYSALVTMGKHHRLFDRQAEEPIDYNEVAKELLNQLEIDYPEIPQKDRIQKVLQKFADKGVTEADLISELNM